MKRLALMVALLLLAGCAHHTTPPPSVPLPTPVSCVPPMLAAEPPGLATPEELAAIPEGPDRYMRLAEDWLRRVARMIQTEPVIAACRPQP